MEFELRKKVKYILSSYQDNKNYINNKHNEMYALSSPKFDDSITGKNNKNIQDEKIIKNADKIKSLEDEIKKIDNILEFMDNNTNQSKFLSIILISRYINKESEKDTIKLINDNIFLYNKGSHKDKNYVSRRTFFRLSEKALKLFAEMYFKSGTN